MFCHMAHSAALPRSRLADLLGQRSNATVEASHVLIPVIRAGLSYRTVSAISRFLDASIEELAAALAIPRRTLDRRKVEGRLDARTSEKIARLARVAARAEEVLAGVEPTRRWLRTPNQALAMAVPLSLLDTDLGAEAVLDVLGRLEHGVYS